MMKNRQKWVKIGKTVKKIDIKLMKQKLGKKWQKKREKTLTAEIGKKM